MGLFPPIHNALKLLMECVYYQVKVRLQADMISIVVTLLSKAWMDQSV